MKLALAPLLLVATATTTSAGGNIELTPFDKSGITSNEWVSFLSDSYSYTYVGCFEDPEDNRIWPKEGYGGLELDLKEKNEPNE